MLSVGREIHIREKQLICHDCDWTGNGSELSMALVRTGFVGAYLCAYCCPACSSLDLAYKGKLLAFRVRQIPFGHDTNEIGRR